MVIRALTNQDMSILHQYLYWSIFVPEGEEAPPFDLIYEPMLYRSIEGFGDLADDYGVVAERDGDVVGACWVRITEHYGHLDDETPSFAIAVHPAYRGRGIGRRMMERVISQLRGRGYRRASLSVQQANRAVGFYQSLGFQLHQTHGDEWIMTLDLSAPIRVATASDLAVLASHDRHVAPDELERLIAQQRVLILEVDGAFAGWLRWGLFWDELPFMNMLYLLEPYRRVGYGRVLVAHWEQAMAARGARTLLTSSLADEPAQHFYRRLGYVDSGALLLPGEATEIIFRKDCGRGMPTER